MSNRRLESLDRFGEERPNAQRRRSSTRRENASRRLSSSSKNEEEDTLMDALVDAFLEVMPDKSTDYAKQILERANRNVQHAILLAMEEPDDDSEVSPAPPRRRHEDDDPQIRAFLEVMPDRNRDFAAKMLDRANFNVEQALLLAMEEQEEETLQDESSPQQNPRSAPLHQQSLTTSDLKPSERHLQANMTESTQFLAQYEREVPTFRPPSPLQQDHNDSPPRKSSPPRQTLSKTPSIQKSHDNNDNRPSSSLRRFSDRSVPNGAESNSDALQKMARVVTKQKQASSRELTGKQAPVQRNVGWNDHLYVVDGNEDDSNDDDAPLPLMASRSSFSSRHSDEDEDMFHASMPMLNTTATPTFFQPSKRRNTLIVDKQKRDTRWQWAQALVGKSFKPYRTMLSEQDDLLPDDDDFEAFEASLADEHFEVVRDCMLDDVDLSEREVAAFFEGFALFNVKIRSLQSQLESYKAVSRVEPRSSMHKSFSASAFAATTTMSNDTMDAFSQSMSRLEPRNDHDAGPKQLGESLRFLSIKKVQTEQNDNEEVQRLLKELEDADKKQKKLEKQLQQAGVIIAEDIPYEEAKAQVERIAKRMGEIGSSEVTHSDKAEQARLREEYFKLEQDMEKFNAALMLTDEYIEEQEELEQKWEDDHVEENLEALKKLRRHMPVNVKSMSEAELSSKPSPNGKILPKSIAKKFKRTNVLQLIRTDPDDIVRMHPSTLENLRVTGLTLTERRAIYAHIKDICPRWKSMQADKMTERKWTWFKMMKQNFKENLDMYEHHVKQYGPPGSHPYATRDNPKEGCPLLGKQCPLKADKQIDYDGDYGFTDEAKYEVSNVRKSDKEDPGAKAKREAMELARDKKANERSVGLKKHYKGKVLQVSLANGSCENMDEILDRIEMLQTKWIEERLSKEGSEPSDDDKRKELAAFTEALNELKLGVLHLAERSGMQLTGKRDANADNPDKRSPIELGLCEEVYDSCIDFFAGIKARMKEIKVKDNRLKSTIEQLRELLDELHDRNVATLEELHCKRPPPSRKHKTYKELTKEVKSKACATSAGAVVEETGPPAGAGDRGGLMAAIAGRGGGRGGRGPPGGLMDAIKAGRGGRGPGRGAAPGLMDAIKGRGGGAGGRGPPGGGRGGLLAAIEGRGRSGGGGRGSAAGGRGDLMSAIAGRGKIE